MRWRAAVAAAWVAAAIVASPVAPSLGASARIASCDVTQAQSLEGKVRTDIKFVNKTSGTVKVYWLDYTGRRVYYDTVAPGKSVLQPTWKTHPWVVLDASGTCIGYVIAPQAEYDIGAPDKPTFTAVVCTIAVTAPSSSCTAQVADASPVRSNPPTGTVTFAAASGAVGKSCTLSGTPGSPGIASCTVSYIPAANPVQGEPPPVTADYSGDSVFAPSSGGSSYYPASVLVPSSVPIDITAGGSGGRSDEGIPTDLMNSNPFPVSADEALTVPGSIDTTMIRAGGHIAVKGHGKVIGAASFHLKPLTSMAITLKLNATGRKLLAKHRRLTATLTVTTRAAGKPTKVVRKQIVLQAKA